MKLDIPHFSPADLLARAGKIPGLWPLVDQARTWNGETPALTWPDDVFLPMGGWTEVLRFLDRTEPSAPLTLPQIQRMEILSAVGAWRPTQDIVRFDPELYFALTEQTDDAAAIPMEIFHRLPAWCIWIDTPGAMFLDRLTPGFFVHLEHDVEKGDDEVRFLVASEDDAMIPVVLHVSADSVETALTETERQAAMLRPESADIIAKGVSELKAEPAVRGMVNLVLYLCAYGFPGAKGGGSTSVNRPAPKRTKKGWRLFPPDKPTIRTIGQEIGDAIRNANADRAERAKHPAEQGGTHASPRPHVRRAHWHGYWLGPLNGERRFDLRWLPPVPVAMRHEDDGAEGRA